MNINEKIEYWVKIAELDISVMEHLYESGDFHYSLFIGHLVLEKILKAHYVKSKLETPPRSHDLVKLAFASNLKLDDEHIQFFLKVNTFNIEARYPEEKLHFYKLCTKEFCLENITIIKEMFLWLKSLI
jgi:HEPN domain-containing protein